jgi:hypothetical protein
MRPIALIINAAKRFGGWVCTDYPLDPPGGHVRWSRCAAKTLGRIRRNP